MGFIIDAISFILLTAGVLIGITGAIGVMRFPDFYSRIHAASITDTLSASMILLGLVLQAGFTLITVKLVFIWLFLWYTSPVAGHALAQAAIHCGFKPELANQEEQSSNN